MRCEREGITCLSLPGHLSGTDEAGIVAEQAAGLNARIVCLDGYDFGYSYQTALRGTGLKLALVDDLKDGPYAADLIINHAPGTIESDYSTDGRCKFLLGLDALMLHPAFWSQGPEETDGSIFICLGGSDPSETTRGVLAEVGKNASREIHVVLGSMNPAIHSLREAYGAVPHIHFHCGLAPREMALLMARSAMGICAASTVALEYLVVGRKLCVLKTADNQNGIFSGLLQLSLAEGFSNALTPDSWVAPVRRYRPDFSTLFAGLLR